MAPLGEWIVSLLPLLYSAGAMDVRTLPGETVLAAAGSSVTLPCQRSPRLLPRTHFRKLALQWAWEEPGALGPGPGLGHMPSRSTLLMVGNNGVVMRGRCGPGQRARVLGERVTGGDFSLLVREVQRGDAGVYHCSGRLGDTLLEKVVRLHVVEVIPDRQGVPVEGSGLELRCQAWEALPLAGVSWRRAGSQVAESGRIRLEDDGRTLRIGGLEIEDQGRWECRLSGDGQTVDAPYTLEIFGFASPNGEIKTTYASLGSSARLSLALTQEPPRERGQAEAGWFRGRGGAGVGTGEGAVWAAGLGAAPGEANGGRLLARLGAGGLTLALTGVRASDRGYYTGYIAVDGRQIERTVRLELTEVTASLAGPVPRGASLRLTVNTSYPGGVEAVEWEHENGSMAEGSDWFREDGVSLFIPTVTPAHAGNWTCVLYWHGELAGRADYRLDVSAFDQREAGPEFSSSRITLIVVFTLFILVITIAVLGLLWKMKSRRQNFPALEVTLATVDLPVKKL